MTITESQITIPSALLERNVVCTILTPHEQDLIQPFNLLLLNDGQDADALYLKKTLENLYNSNSLLPMFIVGIHAGTNRIQEYGVAGRPDFKKRGSKADLYAKFIINELLPAIAGLSPLQNFETIAYAGFSLGGLSALDIAFNNPELFSKVGVFSGSFWWRSKDLGKDYNDSDRIAHAMIRETAAKPRLKFWLQTGTHDETADRNNNGIIDSVDDTIDLIKELETKGYKRPEDIRYVEVVGGSHNAETWAKAMSKFLLWAFGREK